MSCLRVEHIYSYLEKGLSRQERFQVEQHLASCARCSRALEDRRLLLQASQSLPDIPVPADFSRQVMTKISPKISLSAWLSAAAAGFASIALTLSILVLLTRQNLLHLFSQLQSSLWNQLKEAAVFLAKTQKLLSLLITVLQELAGEVWKLFANLSTFLGPRLQIVFITLTLILVFSFLYGIRRKLLSGAKS